MSGVAKSFLYPEINLHGRVRRQPGLPQLSAAWRRAKDADRTFNNTQLGASMSWEIDLFGRLRREQRSRLRPVPRDRRRSSRGARHAGERRRVVVLPAARTRPAARDRTAHARHQRPDGHVLHDAAAGRRVEPARSSIRRKANRAITAASDSRISSGRSPSSSTRSACSPAGRPARSLAAGRSRSSTSRPTVPVGVPATLLERRPDVLAGRAVARRRRMPTSAPRRRSSTRPSA